MTDYESFEPAIHSATILRRTVPTRLSYEDLVAAFERELGHLDPTVNQSLVMRKAPWSEVEAEMIRISGKHALMIIFRANQGAITSLSGKIKHCSLYLVGNPAIARGILDVDTAAALYVPFRVCLFAREGANTASIEYDLPSSSLAALGRPVLTAIGDELDRKIGVVASALAALEPADTAAVAG